MIRPAGIDRERRTGSRLSGANIRLHGGVLVGLCLCLAAGWFELTRARAGREVAWVYVVEWPMFAVFGVYIWWRLWHETTPTDPLTPSPQTPHPKTPHTSDPDATADDPQLAAWQQYLGNLQAVDPPGMPPNGGR